jgi:hypothetical protein
LAAAQRLVLIVRANCQPVNTSDDFDKLASVSTDQALPIVIRQVQGRFVVIPRDDADGQ